MNPAPPESSATKRRAVIDVGTNSVKALVGNVGHGTVEPLWETSDQTRLGTGFYADRRLRTESMERTAHSVARLAEQSRNHGALRIDVIATSAARDAVNGQDLVDAIQRVTGLVTQVIPGDQEALWAYQGVASDPALAGHPLLLVDAGGGSTEFVLGSGDTILFRQSFSLGTVRLLEQSPVSDPPSRAEWEQCRSRIWRMIEGEVLPGIQPLLARADADGTRFVAASGTSTVLARIERGVDSYDRDLLDGVVVSADRLRALRQRLWGLPLVQRRMVPGLPLDRADVILSGLAIYEGVLTVLGLPELRVSMRGIRFGALLALANR